MLQDVRVAVRALLENPVFALTAVGVLALGIGANSAVFGLVDQALLSPPGISSPERVVAVRAKYLKLNLPSIPVSGPDFRDLHAARDTFERAAVMQQNDLTYSPGGTPRVLRGAQVSREWFDVFGATPALGRTFVEEEDRPDGQPAVVLSDAAWQRLFGGDPRIVGRTMVIDDRPAKVVGVMRPDFRWPREVDAWVPLRLPAAESTDEYRFNEHLTSVARLRPGTTVAGANARIDTIAGLVRNTPGEAGDYAKASQWGMFAMAFTDYVAGDSKKAMLVLVGAVSFVLLIACANIAALMVARAASRSREAAVRAALGAGRWRLIRQTMAESGVLAAVGGVAGLAAAYAGMRLMLAVAPAGSVVGLQPAINVPVSIFTLGIAVLSALLFALAPAWQVTRVDPADHLKAAGRNAGGGRHRQRLRAGLVVAETALAMVLLVGAGLLIRSLGKVQEVTPGFEPRGLVLGGVMLPDREYPNPEARVAFYRALVDRLKASPAVSSAAAASPLPFAGSDSTASFEIEGQALGPNEPGPHGRVRVVSPGYFATLGIRLVKGRVFTDDDRIGTAGVVVIDENLAAQYWPGQDPVGKRVRRGSSGPWLTIVGVVGHVLHTSLAGESDKGTYYACLYQRPVPGSWIVARMRSDSTSASVISAAISGIDPTLPTQRAGTMAALVDQSLGPRRFVVSLLGFFAAVALVMAALGLYGVTSYSVAQRTQEMGIRMALGADARSVVGLVLRQGAALALAGGAIGVAGSLALNRLIASQLYNVGPFDPMTFAAMAGVLMATAVAAAYVPARRASRIDPLRALRYE